MKTKNIYLLFGLALFVVRLYLNFAFEFLPGVNGGYNPLQVRSILQTGYLAFPDMPLYFYFNAFIVKIAHLFTSVEIIFINKIVDSFCIALTVIPLYSIRKNILNKPLPIYFEMAIIAFAMLSFSPLALTSELQKNSAAIPLLTASIYYLLSYYKQPSKRDLALAISFFTLTSLTHFGVFSVALTILIISILVKYRWQSLVPVGIIGGLSLGLIFLFDSTRAIRLLQSVLIFISFPRPSPFMIFNVVMVYPILIYGFQLLRKKVIENQFSKYVITVFFISLFVLTFPLMNGDYAMRISLIVFIPYAILLMEIGNRLPNIWQKVMASSLILIVAASLFITFTHLKEPVVSAKGFEDLAKINTTIDHSDKTLFVAKHGLEWWIAWELNAQVAQEKAINKTTFEHYNQVFCVMQKETTEDFHNRQPMPFPNPYAPETTTPIYESAYFKIVELTIDDLDDIQKSAKKGMQPPERQKRKGLK